MTLTFLMALLVVTAQPTASAPQSGVRPITYHVITDTEASHVPRIHVWRPSTPGAFPLIVTSSPQAAVQQSAEVLAGHGFVVAAVERATAAPQASGRQDLVQAVARLRRDAFVSQGRYGVLGLGDAGISALELSASNPEVAATALIDTWWHGAKSYRGSESARINFSSISAAVLSVWTELDLPGPHLLDLDLPHTHVTIGRARAATSLAAETQALVLDHFAITLQGATPRNPVTPNIRVNHIPPAR